MISDPKMSRSEADPMLSPCNDGGRSRIRTADPLGVNDAAHSNSNGLTFVLPVKLSRTQREQTVQSEPKLSQLESPTAYAARWAGIIKTQGDARLLRVMWDGPTERKIRAVIPWPDGALEQLEALVQSRIDQLSGVSRD